MISSSTIESENENQVDTDYASQDENIEQEKPIDTSPRSPN